jgi:hypothetical protein
MKNQYQDKTIECERCKQTFAWTAGEQDFYAQKDLQPPKHCPICRATIKAAKEDKFRGQFKK